MESKHVTSTERPTRASFVPARFDLTDHYGAPVSNETYGGTYVLVFFGFTHCKMVCPRALSKLSGVLDRLGDRVGQFTGLYVTVDPERDTPEVMNAFLHENYPRFTGLTGSLEAIESAKKQFRVFAAKNPDPDDPEGYVVPHSAITYVLGPNGEFITHFTDATEAGDMVRTLMALTE
jgi:protein SCO1